MAKKKSTPPIPDIPQASDAASGYPEAPGRTTVAPEVLLTIARLTTLETAGVSRMGAVAGGVKPIFSRGLGEGVRIQVKDEQVTAELYVILKNNFNIREVSRNIQHNVTRALTEMVGMHVSRVNVHVEDVDYPENHEAAAT